MAKHCGCRNHKGTRKMKFKSKDAALTAIIRYYSRNASGGCEAYRCPRQDGVWHVRSGRSTARDREKERRGAGPGSSGVDPLGPESET